MPGHRHEKLTVEIAGFSPIRLARNSCCSGYLVRIIDAQITGSWMESLRKFRIREAHQEYISSMANRFALISRPSFVFSLVLCRASRSAGDSSPWAQGFIRAPACSPAVTGRAPARRHRDRASTPGFKTYWRNPGESDCRHGSTGRGRENVAAAEVRWPAPTASIEDAGGVAYVYLTGCPARSWSSRRIRQAGQADRLSSNTASARTSAFRPAPS